MDLRWTLLNNLVNFPYLNRIYELFLLLFGISSLFLGFYPLLAEKLHLNQPIKLKKIVKSDILFILIISGLILAGRWPGLLTGYQNPDETLFIAGATKLLHDPIFWRSVDATTAGPLNLYILILPSLFGLQIEYASVRIVGLLLIIVAVVFLYGALRCIYNKSISRLATLPLVVTIALMRHSNYIHYTSELLSIAILSISLFLVCWYYKQPKETPLPFCLGFLLGLTPYTKYQSLPISLTISLIFLHILWLKKSSISQFLRNFYIFLTGTVLFSTFVFISLTLLGILEDFWKSYIQTNLLFYANNWSQIQNFSAGKNSKLLNLWNMIIKSQETNLLFLLTAIIFSLGLIFFILKKRFWYPQKDNISSAVFIYYSFFFLLASLYSVMRPGNPFLHYLLFLLIPSSFLIGVFLGEINEILSTSKTNYNSFKIPIMVVIATAIIIICFFDLWDSRGNQFISKRQFFLDNYTQPEAKVILKYASPGESMAVWGYKADLYVETKLVQATRDGNTPWQVTPNPLQDYYLERYASDLRQSNPSIFVEVVPTKNTNYFNETYEKFPLIANIIKENYHLVEEFEGIKIYLKNK